MFITCILKCDRNYVWKRPISVSTLKGTFHHHRPMWEQHKNWQQMKLLNFSLIHIISKAGHFPRYYRDTGFAFILPERDQNLVTFLLLWDIPTVRGRYRLWGGGINCEREVPFWGEGLTFYSIWVEYGNIVKVLFTTGLQLICSCLNTCKSIAL